MRNCRSSVLFATLLFISAAPEGSLRESANASGVLIGTAVRPAHLAEADYASTLAREFNMVEPEDALKWEIVHPEPQRYDFSQADQIVNFALKNGMKVRGHTLVWHQQNPKWLSEDKYSSEDLTRILRDHIAAVVGHYRGKIFVWDVVNEAFDEVHPGQVRSTMWRNQPGIEIVNAASRELRAGQALDQSVNQTSDQSLRKPLAQPLDQSTALSAGQSANQPAARSTQPPPYAYIERCFRWAHEADPQALLFYNDAEAEEMSPKSDAIYSMVRDFRRRGVPIDGVGLQMHVANMRIDVASVSENIKRLTALGVQVHITELDVAVPVDANGNASAPDLVKQATIYREIAAACLAHPGCTAIQTWGFTDKYSWIGSHSRHTQGAALPFDANYRPKPAYTALRDALGVKTVPPANGPLVFNPWPRPAAYNDAARCSQPWTRRIQIATKTGLPAEAEPSSVSRRARSFCSLRWCCKRRST